MSFAGRPLARAIGFRTLVETPCTRQQFLESVMGEDAPPTPTEKVKRELRGIINDESQASAARMRAVRELIAGLEIKGDPEESPEAEEHLRLIDRLKPWLLKCSTNDAGELGELRELLGNGPSDQDEEEEGIPGPVSPRESFVRSIRQAPEPHDAPPARQRTAARLTETRTPYRAPETAAEFAASIRS
jgi:hypothetical protein